MLLRCQRLFARHRNGRSCYLLVTGLHSIIQTLIGVENTCEMPIFDCQVQKRLPNLHIADWPDFNHANFNRYYKIMRNMLYIFCSVLKRETTPMKKKYCSLNEMFIQI